jgi:ATP-dependent Clp protease ATP-binding subunit ClpC
MNPDKILKEIETSNFGDPLIVKMLEEEKKRKNDKALAKQEKDQNENNEKNVTAEDIAEIVARWSGVPLSKMSEDERSRLLNVEEILRAELIGQERAIKAVSKALKRSGAGLRDIKKPIASFLFCGPTGVGKTQLTKVLTEYLFGSQQSLLRFDMSEYMEKHTVAKLIGSPPGYVGYEEGGLLTDAVRKRPYSVILFDEVEKAHGDVYNLLLQLLDDGILTDSKGKRVYFNNTIVILTSNIGSQVIVDYCNRNMGAMTTAEDMKKNSDRLAQLLEEQLKTSFKPEFLNRLDDTIIFEQLKRSDVNMISILLLDELKKRLGEKEISLQLTSRLLKKITDEGFNPAYGARPLKRSITRLLEDPLSESVLKGKIPNGSKIIADFDNELGKVTIFNLNTDSKVL